MRGRLCLLILLVAATCRPEIIDRLAVMAGKRAITHSDILREIRLSAFLNQEDPDFGPRARRRTAERLLERALMENEIDLGRYPAPESSQIEPSLAALKKVRFPSEEAYRQALVKYGIGEQDLKLYLLEQLAVLRFIDARFGPGVQILEPEMRNYYADRFVPEWDKKGGKPAPSFDAVRQEIEEVLRAERVNRLLDDWLKEAMGRIRIEFKEEAFQ